MKKFSGGCLCRAVRYETTADPLNQRVCHCRECQKALGAAFNARVLLRIEDVSISPITFCVFVKNTLLSVGRNRRHLDNRLHPTYRYSFPPSKNLTLMSLMVARAY